MPKFCVGLLCGLLVCSLAVVPALTQQTGQIEIGGVPLQIGMAKDAVLSRIAERGLTLTKGESGESLLVTARNDRNEYDAMGALTFTSSRLSWASRSWDGSDAGAAKLARNFYFPLNSFEKQGNTSCTTETKEHESPELDSKGFEIHCGKRTVSLHVFAYKEQRPQASLDESIK